MNQPNTTTTAGSNPEVKIEYSNVTERGDYLRRQRDKFEKERDDIQKRIDKIEADAKHETTFLKWDLATANKKIKDLDAQINAGK